MHALVIGGSRGIGAEVCVQLYEVCSLVSLTYHRHERRASHVAARNTNKNVNTSVYQVDLTVASDILRLREDIQSNNEKIDALILNASGGLEQGKEDGYAEALNNKGLIQLAEELLPLCHKNARIVYVTSEAARNYVAGASVPAYEPIALSKFRGEKNLVKLLNSVEGSPRLTIVSGGLVRETATAKILSMKYPSLIGEGVASCSIAEMASTIVKAAQDTSLPNGAVLIV